MTISPIDPLVLAGLLGLALAAMVDWACNGAITWHTGLWAFLFVGGFYVTYGGKSK